MRRLAPILIFALLTLPVAIVGWPAPVAAAEAPWSGTAHRNPDCAVYRALTVQAAPGALLALIDLYKEERALARSLGEEPALWMRHSQGDLWDLLLVYPVGTLSRYFSEERMRRHDEARTASGRTGRELQAAIDAHTAWREEVFVHGPPVTEVKDAWSDAGYFHVEMFQGLAGKRPELLREREMENAYVEGIGKSANLIFTRIAGSATDAFTIGFYRDLQQYAEPSAVTPEHAERAAVAAGFRGRDYIGAYLRELILRHHDTLAVPIP